MNIYIAADHNGFSMKNELVEWLKAEGYDVTDMGPHEYDKGDDYPDYGIKVAEAVAKDTKNRYGVLLCGSGVGMAVVADKVKGIRAALIHDPKIAEAAQRDDDINVLALGSSYISPNKAKDVITAWLSTPFSEEERHKRRIGKIEAYETK
ncbi:MAG: RpiB/LacA/LacB family sugar-phosphate isomerase [Acidobacteriota bacterium]